MAYEHCTLQVDYEVHMPDKRKRKTMSKQYLGLHVIHIITP